MIKQIVIYLGTILFTVFFSLLIYENLIAKEYVIKQGITKDIYLKLRDSNAININKPHTLLMKRSNKSLENRDYVQKVGQYNQTLSHIGDCSSRDKKIFFIGSSTTESNFVDEGSRWVDKLQGLLDDEYNNTYCLFNFGVGGNTLINAQTVIFSYNQILRPQYTFLMFNGTDLGYLINSESHNYHFTHRNERKFFNFKEKLEFSDLFKYPIKYFFPKTINIISKTIINRSERSGNKVIEVSNEDESKIINSFIVKYEETINLIEVYGSIPVILLEPRNPVNSNLSHHLEVRKHYKLRGREYDRFYDLHKKINLSILDLCQKRKLLCIDNSDINNDKYMYDEGHLNSFGSNVFANKIFNFFINYIK